MHFYCLLFETWYILTNLSVIYHPDKHPVNNPDKVALSN